MKLTEHKIRLIIRKSVLNEIKQNKTINESFSKKIKSMLDSAEAYGQRIKDEIEDYSESQLKDYWKKTFAAPINIVLTQIETFCYKFNTELIKAQNKAKGLNKYSKLDAVSEALKTAIDEVLVQIQELIYIFMKIDGFYNIVKNMNIISHDNQMVDAYFEMEQALLSLSESLKRDPELILGMNLTRLCYDIAQFKNLITTMTDFSKYQEAFAMIVNSITYELKSLIN